MTKPITKKVSLSEGNYPVQISTEQLDKLKKKTCGCEESELGYHTKDCTLYEYGWNDAIDKVKQTSVNNGYYLSTDCKLTRAKTTSTVKGKFKYELG